MEEFKLSDQEEDYFAETRKVDENEDHISKKMEKIENRLNLAEQRIYTIEDHQKEIKNIYDKIMDLEDRIINIEDENNNGFFDTLDDLWEDFKNFVKYKL